MDRVNCLAPRGRLSAAIEVALGAAVVILHNVYRAVPNEVPILVAILWLSLLLRRRGWGGLYVFRRLRTADGVG